MTPKWWLVLLVVGLLVGYFVGPLAGDLFVGVVRWSAQPVV